MPDRRLDGVCSQGELSFPHPAFLQQTMLKFVARNLLECGQEGGSSSLSRPLRLLVCASRLASVSALCGHWNAKALLCQVVSLVCACKLSMEPALERLQMEEN